MLSVYFRYTPPMSHSSWRPRTSIPRGLAFAVILLVLASLLQFCQGIRCAHCALHQTYGECCYCHRRVCFTCWVPPYHLCITCNHFPYGDAMYYDTPPPTRPSTPETDTSTTTTPASMCDGWSRSSLCGMWGRLQWSCELSRWTLNHDETVLLA